MKAHSLKGRARHEAGMGVQTRFTLSSSLQFYLRMKRTKYALPLRFGGDKGQMKIVPSKRHKPDYRPVPLGQKDPLT